MQVGEKAKLLPFEGPFALEAWVRERSDLTPPLIVKSILTTVPRDETVVKRMLIH